MIFVDTNYFARYLIPDAPSQYKEAKGLFDKAAKGKIKLFTSLVVIFELLWVFTKFYKMEEKEVLEAIKKICGFGFLQIEERDILKNAISLCEVTNLGLEDSFNLVYSKEKGATDFKTFDLKLQKAFKTKI